MIMNLGEIKLRLIQEIMNLNNVKSLRELEQKIQIAKESLEGKDMFWNAIKPIRKSNTIEEMIASQGYKPIDKKNFYEQVSKLNIEESLEDLLEMLRK